MKGARQMSRGKNLDATPPGAAPGPSPARPTKSNRAAPLARKQERWPARTRPEGRERVPLPPGATVPLDNLTYPQLYQHSRQLGQLARWDGRALFTGAGVLGLGGAIGAIATGESIWSKGVLVFGAIGIALLLGGLFIRRASVVAARDLKITFDQTLTMYETNPDIKAIKDHLDLQLPAAPKGFTQRARAFFNF
jgi:hypothetical protein